MRLLSTIAAFIPLATAVCAQNMLGFPGVSKVTYIGPGDLVSSATVWYGLRAYSAAVAATGTQKAINIRRTSDSSTSDILILTTGGLDLTTANAFCAATTCFVTKWYDQSGNIRDALQATAANQPQLLFSCVGALPCISALSSASIILATSGNITPATGALSLSMVGWSNRTSSNSVFIEENGTNNRFGSANAANSWQITGGTSGFVQGVAADSVWHTANVVLNGASSVVNIDGTETTGTATGNTTAATTRAALGSTTDLLKMGEAGIWDNVMFTSGQRNSLSGNQHGWWNI